MRTNLLASDMESSNKRFELIGWRQVALGDVTTLLTGFPFKSNEYSVATSGTKLLRGDNIVQGTLRWDGVKRWPIGGKAVDPIYLLRSGDVVLAMDRPWIEAGLKYAAIAPKACAGQAPAGRPWPLPR